MKIQIQYFALLREESGLSEEAFEFSGQTPEDLYQALKEKHNFSINKDSLKVAVNDSFAAWQTQLNENDSVTFIPPVAGG